MPERIFAQEYEAVFLEDAGGVFRKVKDAVDAERTENEAPQAGAFYSCGVDLARTQDFTVITVIDVNGRQVYQERFNQISWPRQIARIEHVARLYNDAPIVVDSTGKGEPIFEALQALELTVIPYVFSNASKGKLIDNLAMKIERGEARLMNLDVQTNELLAYQ